MATLEHCPPEVTDLVTSALQQISAAYERLPEQTEDGLVDVIADNLTGNPTADEFLVTYGRIRILQMRKPKPQPARRVSGAAKS